LLYLLDANVLIRAHEDYYGLEQVPQFWDWLREVAAADIVKMPYEIHDEIAVSTGPLKNWITHTDIKEALILAEEVDAAVLNEVLAQGYSPDLTDSELEKIGRDPFLISYARMAADRIVVTKEVSRPSAQRANRQVPDVCNAFGVQCMTDFDFFKAAGFKTR
jgi:hypothetical protein